MSAADGAEAAVAKPAEMPQSPFLALLVRQMRAHDLNNVWEKKSDLELLEPFVLSREQRRRIPIIPIPTGGSSGGWSSSTTPSASRSSNRQQ